jgi:hypothetical protein
LNQFKVAIIQETKVAKQKEWQRERKQGASLVDGTSCRSLPHFGSHAFYFVLVDWLKSDSAQVDSLQNGFSIQLPG